MADTKRAMDRLMVPEPYDMDTMMGTNNSGVLMFPPYLEDTDTVSSVISGDEGGDGSVYNAQDSVLWMNLRDAFRPEIATMYRNLRAEQNAKWSADYVIEYFSEMQSKWPEAMFNEDGRTKYLIPLIDPVTYDKETGQYIRTDSYLSKLQGSKAEQRKWWVFNRFRYIDSKYNAGDAASKVIYMRLFNGGTLTLTPVIDLYVGVRFGGGSTVNLKRTTAGKPQSFEYATPASVTEMETWVYSADLIADLGDLSVFYPNEIDISKATRLRSLTIGSLVTGYSNTNLVTINASNNPLLEYINCANCPRLAISPDLEKSTRLKEAYFEGSGITGVALADGCTIETLHLPDTITSLILMNLDKLTDLQIAGLSNVKTLMLSNMNTSIIDPISTVEQLQPGAAIYIDGLNLEMADAAAIDEFYDFLDTMKGVTRIRNAKGEWDYTEEDKAQVSGRIHTDSLTGAEIAEFESRYQYIDVVADHTTSQIFYHNWEADSAVIAYETVVDGVDATNAPTGVTHDSTAQYTFTFLGWSRTPEATVVDPNALTNVTADRHVYAVYQLTVQTYTVTFTNPENSADNDTVTNVPYGTAVVAYPKSTEPSVPDEEDMLFIGWEPEPTNIQSNVNCVAQFRDYSSITLQYFKRTLKVVDDSETQLIANAPDSCLRYQKKLTTLVLPRLYSTMGVYVFAACTALKTASLPNYTGPTGYGNSGDGMFNGDSALESVNIPLLAVVRVETFAGCSSLQSVDFPNATEVRSKGFARCTSLSSVNLPLVTSVGQESFAECSSLTTIYLPAVKTIGKQAFFKCTEMTDIELDSLISIGQTAFAQCNKLERFIIRNQESVASLYSATTVPYGSFYVPDALVEDYKAATNWSVIADRIRPLSEVNNQ